MRSEYSIRLDGSARPSDVPNEEWDRPAYEAAVSATLAQVMQTLVGQIVVRFIEAQSGHVTVFPEVGWHTGGAPRAQSTSSHGYLLGCPLSYDGFGNPRPRAPVGDGEHADAWVWFSPGLYLRYHGEQGPHGLGRFGDAVLLHELVHAMRVLRGVCDPSPRRRRYDTFEEVCAVMVTNMYRSEVGRTLIGSHTRYHVRETYAAGSSEASERDAWEAQQIARFREQMPVLTTTLGNVSADRCAYNPFRGERRRRLW